MAEKTNPKNKKTANGKKSGKMYEFKLEFNLKNIVIGLFVLFFLFSLIGSLGGGTTTAEKPLSSVITDIKANKVTSVDVEDAKLTVTYKDGQKFTSRKEPQAMTFQGVHLTASAHAPSPKPVPQFIDGL